MSMRLIHVTPFYEPAWGAGGMARAAAGLARALARAGHDVTVTTALLDPAHPRDELQGGVRVVRFPGPALLRRWLVPWAPGLRGFLEREALRSDAGHVHGHRSGLAVTAARSLRSHGVPYVLQPHGTWPRHGQRESAKRIFDALGGGGVVAGAAALVAVSEAEARELPRASSIVPNGVEMPRLARAPRGARPRLLFVGSDRPQKRGPLLVPLLQALSEAELEMVGAIDPDFAARFGSACSRVRVRGVLDPRRLAEAYAAADLVVHPAVGEAFGLVPFEAALLGTASVVASGHGCGERYARAGGCVVAPDDSDALIAAVKQRLEQPALAQAEARAVAEHVERELSWARAAAAMSELYTSLPGARSRVVA